MSHRGLPIDVATLARFTRQWDAIRLGLIRKVGQGYDLLRAHPQARRCAAS